MSQGGISVFSPPVSKGNMLRALNRSSLTNHSFCFHLPPGFFSVQNVAPQPDGDSSKVKVKVRVNVHGIFSVSSASLIEKQKGEGEDMQIDSEPMVQNEGRAEDQVHGLFCAIKEGLCLK